MALLVRRAERIAPEVARKIESDCVRNVLDNLVGDPEAFALKHNGYLRSGLSTFRSPIAPPCTSAAVGAGGKS